MEPIDLATTLYPIHRSLTGNGVRETLKIIKSYVDDLKCKQYKSGERCFDWTIPGEWNINEAWIKNSSGEKIIDLKDNNLHVIGYSTQIRGQISRDELLENIFTLEKQPTAIPYITSYYKKRWGFCMAHNQMKKLNDKFYDVLIDSSLNENGVLNYGEIILKGRSRKEILLSTYICHPSMANNEVSGPVVATFIAEWLKNKSDRKYTYRILFLPETIGAIAYISHNLNKLKKNVIGGFVLTCIGDERNYSYLPSKNGNTLSDKAAKISLESIDKHYKSYTWNDRGSDERQYCAQGVELPICSIMRTKYGEYPEYHTSMDNFDVVTNKGLQGGINAVKGAIEVIETNYIPKCSIICEPQLSKRGLYPTLSDKDTQKEVENLLNVISYIDGKRDVIDIAMKSKITYQQAIEIVERLRLHKIVYK